MKKALLANAIRVAADPQRARHFFDSLPEVEKESLPAEHARILAALFSGSPAQGNLLAANPDWIHLLEPERVKFPRREQGLRKEVSDWLEPLLAAKDQTTALTRLRQFRQREMLRIAARDLARLANAPEITREISAVADVCLSAVWRICRQRFTDRYGQPWHQDVNGVWQPTQSCVLGMGKLGGEDLNYSSDVDVLFVFTEAGEVFKEPPTENISPRPVMPNHQFFNRLAEAFVTEVSRVTPEGALFRVDLRLRPEGDAGPLSRSLDDYENYYAQWGQTWERMMLIKARCVAGDKNLAGEFLETIQPFRYPRAVSEDVLHEVAAMKDRIETEILRADELERNVKLGRGGIREIEFSVQSQQLLHAGNLPFLQGAQTLPALEKLVQYQLLPAEDGRSLREAYCFLRDVEHRLQMEENLQTHTIPQERGARERLAKLMGFPSEKEFESARRTHTGNVRRIFDSLLKSEKPPAGLEFLPGEFSGAEEQWKKLLSEYAFQEPDRAFYMLREFMEGPGYVHVSPRTVQLARKLLARFLALCPKPALHRQTPPLNSHVLSDPDRVVTRLDQFIGAYGARATLFEMWNSNPAMFELLLLLFDRSEFLAELAIRTPDLVDELVASGRLRRRKAAAETLRDLGHGLHDEDQRLWMRRYHQAELMRIGLRDILGLADPEQYLVELSALADACLQYALEVVMRNHSLKKPPFVIIGLGKLGGAEIDYGSDLDIVFVTDSKAKTFQKLQRMALEVMELLSSRTEMGLVFHTDARLRPDGEKGLLVNTLAAYEEYYRERAQLWEIQSLTRTRPVAGDLKLGEKFQKLAAELTNFSKLATAPAPPRAKGEKKPQREAARALPSCVGPNWKQKIHEMRLRIEKARTPAGKDELAIKTGRGGLMDAEFVAQTFCLENGWREPNTLRALERGRDSAATQLSKKTRRPTRNDFERLIENYRRLRRVEGILRRWSYESETVLPDDPASYRRVCLRCGFAEPGVFRKALAQWRLAIRDVYAKIFPF